MGWQMSRFFTLLIIYILSCPNLVSAEDSNQPLTIFAAASLTNVLQQHAENWAKDTNNPIPHLSFAASAIMARQIKAGAPVDIFISANPAWVTFVEEAGLTHGNRHSVAQNQLVLAAPRHAPVLPAQVRSGQELLTLSANQRLAIADPALAPAGAYAKQYLQNLGIWERISPHLAYGSNVRQALLLVERGGLYGFVYASDAQNSPHVQIIYTVPEALSGAIIYQAAKIKGAHQNAEGFLAYLTSQRSQSVWHEAGFTTPVSN